MKAKARTEARKVVEEVVSKSFKNAPRITSAVEIIDRSRALDYLKKNKGNRKLSRHASRRYAEQMKRGEWALTGETIVFDVDGFLRNGQNRLQAIVEADTAVPILVARGVDRDASLSMDQGVKRTGAHALQMQGENQASHLAPALKNYIFYATTVGGAPINLNQAISNKEIVKILDEHGGMRDSVRKCNRHEVQKVVQASRAAAGHYIFSCIDSEQADTFIWSLSDGVGLVKSSPIYRLRELFINDKIRGVRRHPSESLALLIKAWNLWRQGKPAPAKGFRFLSTEEFPVAK